MKRYLRIISLILCLLMLSVCIVSCDDGKPTNTDTPAADSGDTETQTDTEKVSAEVSKIDKHISEMENGNDFGGADFVWLMRSVDTESEFTGDLKNDAIYSRNLEIENDFNVNFKLEPGGGSEKVAELVQREVLAGSTTYDIASSFLRNGSQIMILNNLLMDITDFEYLDLGNEWWPANLRDTLSINDRIYFLTGLMDTDNYYSMNCVLFNKYLAEEYKVEDLYQLVYDGEWTIDKFFEVSEKIPKNATGDGVYRFVVANGLAFIYGSGLKLTQYDDDGVPYMLSETPVELVDLADKLSAVFGDKAISLSNDDADNKYFVEDKSLFIVESVGGVDYFRQEDVEFGILPIPKATKAQKNYYSFTGSLGPHSTSVPKVVKDVTMVDVILEALGALTEKYVTPAIQETVLKGRSTHDKESMGMLDIIFSSSVDEFVILVSDGNVNWDGPLLQGINKAILGDSGSMASTYSVNAKLINRKIKNLVKALKN